MSEANGLVISVFAQQTFEPSDGRLALRNRVVGRVLRVQLRHLEGGGVRVDDVEVARLRCVGLS